MEITYMSVRSISWREEERGVNEVYRGIAILASCEFLFIKVHKNLVKRQINYKSIVLGTGLSVRICHKECAKRIKIFYSFIKIN